jgi:hypothetical protein
MWLLHHNLFYSKNALFVAFIADITQAVDILGDTGCAIIINGPTTIDGDI